MFTGLVEEQGRVVSFSNGELRIACSKVREGTTKGDSIAVNGVCLTVTDLPPGALSFHVSPTSSENSRLRAGTLSAGEEVNLERALTLATRLGGHLVTGHVDGLARIIDIRKQGEDRLFEFQPPPPLRSLIARKGSVTLDGVSLTVAEVLSSSFVVAVIPQTLASTNLRRRLVGDFVHIEADILARYVANMLQHGTDKPAASRSLGGIYDSYL